MLRSPRASGSVVGATLLAAACLLTHAEAAAPARVSIAAASNLVYVLGALNAEFRRTAPEIVITPTTGASGSLFAQLQHGAPFDLFLSADTDYPKQAVAAGLAEAQTLRTFATGRLVLWTTRRDLDVADIAAAVRSPTTRKIATAQPKTAPYGRAARAVLEKLGVGRDAEAKLVFGENISQTAQFIETGNADCGFVALALVQSPQLRGRGKWMEVPPRLYADVPLDHAVVLTHRGTANAAAQRYLDFLGSAAAKRILRDFGYGVPE